MNYVEEIQRLVDTALNELEKAISEKKIQSGPVSEEAFLCRWIAQAIKKQRFGNIVAREMTTWLQQGRSMGKHANVKGHLLHIQNVYQHFFPDGEPPAPVTHRQFEELIASLDNEEWMVHTEYEINRKVRVISDGLYSFAVCSETMVKAFDGRGVLVKPLSLFVRCPEPMFVKLATKQNLLVSKVSDYKSIVKYHAEYMLWPENRATCLAVLPEEMKV
ncbi:hypothetical protein CS022_04115 [Veronia nyctiphanis]|uniref:DUF2913 family protein n=1 Tax=Veronia nyctiphanis TaxID=1278244 RepID=A0A4Q0YSQ7_9GAMM|nr:DUF2913 family protein [Veronia nyctiphanis]RXJ74252.1 hypothetical protein CS022_04115 [Veronia nyctiphanis]